MDTRQVTIMPKQSIVRLSLLILLLLILMSAAWLSLSAIAIPKENEAYVETMEAANQLYDEGRFAEAALTYEGLVSQGIEDGRLFYNLGNAYHKQNDLGRTILNYERALLFIPRDADLRTNLQFANDQAEDKYEAQRESLIGQASLMTSRWLTVNEMALLALFCWFGVAALWILLKRSYTLSRRWREFTRYNLVLMALGLVCIVLLLGVRLYADQVRPQGILLPAEVDVLSGPNPNNMTEFTLHAGAKITVLEKRGQWLRLALPGDELQGWVPAETVGAVNGFVSGF